MLLLGLCLNAVGWLLGTPAPGPEPEPDPEFAVTFTGPDELGFIEVYVNDELIAWDQRREWATEPELLPIP